MPDFKRLYKHIQYGASIQVKDTNLPSDKRKIPWPRLRRMKRTDIKTWAEYYNLYSQGAKVWLEREAARVFNNCFTKIK